MDERKQILNLKVNNDTQISKKEKKNEEKNSFLDIKYNSSIFFLLSFGN
jgi:hypothetical protein